MENTNKCYKCGADMAWSERVNKPYCSAKCWLNPILDHQPQLKSKQQQPIHYEKEVDWNSISFGKCKHAFLIEAFKRDWELDLAENIAEEWAKASMRKNTIPFN